MITLNERLKTLRKAKDMTQEQLAYYMNVSPQAVSRWETGATSPDISALPLLAELFEITVDELLGIDENAKQKEITSIIADCEKMIDKNKPSESIIKLREALNKYPNNDRLLTCLMYALYAASEDEELCRKYDPEIISIYYRIQRYSTDNYCRNETLRLLFRHYCDTKRIAEAKKLADSMASSETCYEYNIYWALEGEERLDCLKKLISADLNRLLWDIWAFSYHANINDNDKQKLDDLRKKVEIMVNSESMLK